MISIQTSPAARSEQQSPRKNVTQPTILRFGSEIDVDVLTGLSRKTLQKDRQVGRSRFPWYKSGKRVHYDLEKLGTIRGIRAEGSVQSA